MANQRNPKAIATTAELRTTAATANQILATIDLTALFAQSWNGAVFVVRGSALSFEEDGGSDYHGFVERMAKVSRRGGTVVLGTLLDPNNDPTPFLGGGLDLTTPMDLNVSGNTIRLRITPRSAGNIRHYGIISVAAYQFQ